MMKFSKIGPLLSQTFSLWQTCNAMRLSAALAFYTVLSLAPLVILALRIASWAIGSSNAQTQLLWQVEDMIGREGRQAVSAIIEQAQSPAKGAIASALGALTLLFGASGVFGEMRSSLNAIWDIPEESGGFWRMLRQRFWSFGLVLAVGFLFLTSLLATAGLAAAAKYVGGLIAIHALLLQALNHAVSFLGAALLFALIFRYVPDSRTPWKDLWAGSLLTAFFFTLGKILIGAYLGTAAVGSAYGAAGSLVVVISWVYYSSLIFFFGAAFTRVVNRSEQPATTVPVKAHRIGD